MRGYSIYKITYLNGDVKLYKQLKDFFSDYKLKTEDTRTYDNFRYIISNKLYEKEHNHRYNLLVSKIEKHNFEDFLQDYLKEYKVVRQVKESKYTQSTAFYNKIYDLAKYRIECA